MRFCLKSDLGKAFELMTPLLSRIAEDSETSIDSSTELTGQERVEMGSSKRASEEPLVCEEGPSVCALLMTITSLLLIVVSLPLSLFMVVKVVQVMQEYF